MSSSSSADNEWKYGVFLSFRGPDTRKGFTGHLYKALRDKGIRTFIDDQDLMQGDRIPPALMNAIQESRIAIVVFSKTYASSAFCLEELAMIMEVEDMVVWPVFYEIDPSVVRHQKESFGEAMAKHEAREKDKVGKWKSALRKAADIIGWNFRPEGSISEYQLIEEIVKRVSNELLTKKKKRVAKDIINHSLQRDPAGSNSSGQKRMTNLGVNGPSVQIRTVFPTSAPNNVGLGTIGAHSSQYNPLSRNHDHHVSIPNQPSTPSNVGLGTIGAHSSQYNPLSYQGQHVSIPNQPSTPSNVGLGTIGAHLPQYNHPSTSDNVGLGTIGAHLPQYNQSSTPSNVGLGAHSAQYNPSSSYSSRMSIPNQSGGQITLYESFHYHL